MIRTQLATPFWTIVALVVAGCASAPGATMQQLQRRAWLDSGCAPAQLILYHVDKRTKVLEGCRQRLVYVESCEHIRGEYSCTWVLNNSTWSSAAGAQAEPFAPFGAPAPPSSAAAEREDGSSPRQRTHPWRRPKDPADEDVIPPPRGMTPLPSDYLPSNL